MGKARFFGAVRMQKQTVQCNTIFQVIFFTFQHLQHGRKWRYTAPDLHGLFVSSMMPHRHIWAIVLQKRRRLLCTDCTQRVPVKNCNAHFFIAEGHTILKSSHCLFVPPGIILGKADPIETVQLFRTQGQAFFKISDGGIALQCRQIPSRPQSEQGQIFWLQF